MRLRKIAGDMDDFDPRNVGDSLDEIIPRSGSDTDFETAESECEQVVEKLTADVSGIGPKAAKRYLMRYEYGFSTKSLANRYGVTSPTITNQTQLVRDRVLRYPKLSQIVGNFRAKRANLSEPHIDENLLWDGQFDLQSTIANGRVEFSLGSYSDSFSWKFFLEAESSVEDTSRHLLVDYLVDAETGVMLKRSIKGISYNSWRRAPYFEQERQYTVYPLPNRDLPDSDGTLIDAIEYHIVYDVTSAFDDFDWQAIEIYANSNTDIEDRSAALSLPQILFDRIKHENTIDPIFDYAREVHVRNNIEYLLRLYPLEYPSDLPNQTVQLLWNGKIARLNNKSGIDLATALGTSRISIRNTNRV